MGGKAIAGNWLAVPKETTPIGKRRQSERCADRHAVGCSRSRGQETRPQPATYQTSGVGLGLFERSRISLPRAPRLTASDR